MEENPAEDLKSPKIQMAPTLPFEEEEERQILLALASLKSRKCRSRTRTQNHSSYTITELLTVIAIIPSVAVKCVDIGRNTSGEGGSLDRN